MYRSLLFVPANDAKRIARVHERGADAVILDLEDAVADDAKEAARAGVRATADGLRARGVDVFVRINAPWRAAVADIDAIMGPALAGIIAPKVRDAAHARVVGEILREAEVTHGVTEAVGLIALIESAEGVSNAAAIAATLSVSGLALGTEDFSAQLGVASTAAVLELPCKLLALAAAPRGLMALGAPISIGAFQDIDAYAAAIAQARAFGMNGALCIHPTQVTVANAGFAPDAAEVEDARGVLAAWAIAAAAGQAVTKHAGRMIDAPVVTQARRTLARAKVD